jgi:hypothetical protein
MSTLQRRLARLEEVLLPKPWQPVCMLTEPASDALTEEWADYQQQVEAAKARGDFVAVVSLVRQGDRPHYDKGVTYYASEFEARLVEASMLPSERANDSLLVEVLKDAMGNVVGPMACC